MQAMMPEKSHVQNENHPLNESEADSLSRELIAQMTLREKVYELHGRGLIRYGLSMFFSNSLKLVKAGGSKKHGIPPVIFSDGPRGVSFVKGATAFPVTMARGASWDVELESRIGEAMAKEVRAIGGNYSGAGCMNLLRHPAWGRAQETYGEDPHHLGEMASALVEGIQRHHVQACVKHFAANSMENNRFGGSMNMSERTLHEVYLPHFKKVIQRGAASVMSAYNKLNGEYCGESKYLLTEILRKDWDFKGYVTSDWMWGLFDTQKGIRSGMNVEMPEGKVYSYKKINRALKNGDITMQDVDALVLPVLSTKLLFASRKDFQNYPRELLGCREHVALAREAAEKSAVLLKNENSLLPLDKNVIKKIAVLGSLAEVKQTGDKGSSQVNPNYIITPLKGISDFLKSTGVHVLTAPQNDRAQLESILRDADAVLIVAGTTHLDEGEFIGDGKIRDKDNPDKQSLMMRIGKLGIGGDRKYLHLHQPDIELINLAAAQNKKVIVSLVAGAAITVEEWQENVPAIIQTFYNGMEGGSALAKIIFGAINPSGKLPFTVPVHASDLPPFDSFAEQAEYGYYHGYTLFDKENKQARFPFGFGLSYTDFEISGLKLEKAILSDTDSLTISCLLKNTGSRKGAEVVQLYMSPPKTEIDKPEKLLRGFKKIELEPGEEKQISMTIAVRDLALYFPESKTWKVERGIYEMMLGNSSVNAHLLRAKFEIK